MSFECAARVKKRVNFKPNLFFDQMESCFLLCKGHNFPSHSYSVFFLAIEFSRSFKRKKKKKKDIIVFGITQKNNKKKHDQKTTKNSFRKLTEFITLFYEKNYIKNELKLTKKFQNHKS